MPNFLPQLQWPTSLPNGFLLNQKLPFIFNKAQDLEQYLDSWHCQDTNSLTISY